MSKIGISNFHYVKMKTEDTATSDPVYAEAQTDVVHVPGLVSVNVETESNTAELYADNMLYEVAEAQGKTSLTLNLADLDMQTQADLLGHTYDSTNKTLIKKSSDTAPYVAVGFEFLMGNGKKRCVALYKGKFGIPTQAGQTKGENVEFQTSEITASFAALKGGQYNVGKWEYDKDFDKDASTDGFYAYTAFPPLASQ